MITLELLQEQVGEWSRRNFPKNLPHHPLLGLVEEFDELDGALETDDYLDAIADCTIYLADYCARNDLTLAGGDLMSANRGALGKLCHYHLKGEQGIRHTPEEVQRQKQAHVEMLIAELQACAINEGEDFLEVVEKVWANVQQRDWQKNPITAAKIAEEAR